MHKIKSNAHRDAWYNDDNTRNYNPFGKIRARVADLRGDNDLESGLAGSLQRGKTYQSETGAPSSSEIRRRSYYDGAPAGPIHSMTLPPNSPTSETRSNGASAFNGNGNGKEKEREEDGKDKDAEKEKSEDSSAATMVEQQSVKTNGQARKRKMGGLLGIIHKEEGPDGTEADDKHDGKPPPQKFTAAGQLRATLFNSWINVLLIAAPIGIALNYAKVSPIVVFVVNFIAIIPLAAMLSYATEEIALRTGETIGGLLNATFGNAVELIVSILALVDGQVLIVQTSLIGSMLSNLLLVMGMCFFFGGWSREKQHFNITVAQTASSLLALAIGSLIIPTAFQSWAKGPDGGPIVNNPNTVALSRGVAVLLLFVYACYLYFQLKTHVEMYNRPSEKVAKRKAHKGDASRGIAQMGANMSATAGGDQAQENPMKLENDREEPQLSMLVALLTLAISTALVALCAEYLVDSINAVTATGGISKNFVGLILLPIVGNAAEHATAVTVACKDKMDLAIGVAVGSSMQIALFVLPFIVIVGWGMGNEQMTLDFDPFQIIILFVAVLLVNYLIQDGESHWLEGVLLQVLYLIIAVAAWFYPAATATGTTTATG